MNFPLPVYPKSFNNNVKHISAAAEKICQGSMDVAAASLRTNNEVSGIAVSVDGTWQK